MKKLSLAALLLVAATLLGATVLREPVAHAASATLNVFVTNDSSHPVPVHEQGTASVQGTVSSRPVAPGSTWLATESVVGNLPFLAGPSSTAINVTSLAISPIQGTEDLFLDVYTVPATETTCSVGDFAYHAWHVRHVSAPFSVAFPTPLQIQAPADKKVCLAANSFGLVVNASGFFGN